MIRRLKRLSCTALALCMLLTMLPLGAFAAAPAKEIWTNANDLLKKFDNGNFKENSSDNWYTNDTRFEIAQNQLTYFPSLVGDSGITLDTASGGSNYFAEICANAQNSTKDGLPMNMIWQDVLVKPDTEYAWSLYHRARMPKTPNADESDGNDYMAVMIGSVTDQNYAIDQTGMNNCGGLELQEADQAGSPYSPGTINNREPNRPEKFTCRVTPAEGWVRYSGSYTVPSADDLTAAGCKTADGGYYVLRFAFVSGPTVYGASGGNLITGVRFSRAFDLEYDLTRITTDPASLEAETKINEGYDYEVVLKPAEYYMMPEVITVQIGAETYEVPTDGSADVSGEITFDPITGKLKMPEAIIDGDVTITAKAVSTVSQVLTGFTTNNEDSDRQANGDFSSLLDLKKGYAMPESIDVKIGNDTYTVKTDGTSDGAPDGVRFDPTTGEISITKDAIGVELVVITATAIPVLQQELTNMNTSNPGNTLAPDGSFSTTLTAKPGYRLPASMEVEIDGVTHTILTDGTSRVDGVTFDPATGKLTILDHKLGVPVTVRAVAEKISSVPSTAKVLVSLTDTMGPVFGKTVTVTNDSGAVITLTPDANGRYITTNLPYGEYTLEVNGYPALSQTISVNAPEVRKDLQLDGNGDKLGEVKGDSLVELGQVGNLAKNEQFEEQPDPTQGFTSAELAAYPLGTGGHLKLELQVANIVKNTAPTNLQGAIGDIDQLAKKASQTIGYRVDLTMHKYAKKNTDPAYTYLGQLVQIPQLISVEVSIPAELRNKSNLTVYRYHGAVAEKLSSSDGTREGYQISKDKKTMTIYIRNFSLYAIGYTNNSTGNTEYPGNNGYVGGSGSSGGTTQPGFTLGFQTNGGSTVGPVVGQKNDSVDLSKYAPIRSGYTFDGWYLDQALTKPAGKLLTLDENITLYAKWTATPRPNQLTDRHVAYLVGRDDGLVYPDFNITRAEVATIFFRLLTDELRQSNLTTSSSFSDVKNGSWYTTAISTLAKMNILGGRDNGSFDPNAPITRAEFATIAARFSDRTYAGPQQFVDVTNHWAAGSIATAAHVGWIQGDSSGCFRPNEDITRAEATTLVNRILCRNPEQVSDLRTDMTTWQDNMNTAAWYYLAVQEATNSHDYESKLGTIFESWTVLTQTPDWTTYET